MGQKIYLRTEKSLAYLRHLPSRNPVVGRILKATGQKYYICNRLLTPSLFRLILARLSLSQSFEKNACKRLHLKYFTSADRISMRVLKFAKFIPERRHNKLQSQKFLAG